MPYTLLIGIAVVVVAIGFVVMFRRPSDLESGDYVSQAVLTRIKAEYRSLH